MPLLINSITEWKVRMLSLRKNSRPTILKEIARVRFTALINLKLANNQISSIEGLTNIDMPHIKCLQLSKNNITSLKTMRKAFWPALQELTLEENYFGNGKGLTEGYFPQIIILYLFDPWEADEKSLFTDHCFPSKMQAHYLKQLSIRHIFCFSRSTQAVFKRRWFNAYVD